MPVKGSVRGRALFAGMARSYDQARTVGWALRVLL